MSKSAEIKFVGQPIIKQIINLVEKANILSLIKQHDNDRYLRHLSSAHILLRCYSGY
jgi:hypothetical protein